MKSQAYSPRHKNTRNLNNILDPIEIRNKPKYDLPPNIDSLDSILTVDLSHANSDSDKMFICQKAFDCLINEFHICRPLLSRIKKQYDMIGADLISRKRELTFNTESVSSAEDSLPDAINELQKARNQEFSQKKSESEFLLDKMTKLRLKRSELLAQLDNLTNKEEELSNRETLCINNIIDLTSKLNEMNDFIKSTENSSLNKKNRIEDLHDEISSTQQSSDDIGAKDQYFQSQTLLLEKEECDLTSSIQKIEQKNLKLDKEITDLQNDAEDLSKKRNDFINKLEFVEIGYHDHENKLKNLIKDSNIDIDLNLPTEEILAYINDLT